MQVCTHLRSTEMRNREKHNVCVECTKLVCNGCVAEIYVNRPHYCICEECKNFKEPSFRCGRCESTIPTHSLTFFCSVCGSALCGNCIESSFEMGLLKCSMCSEHPLRVNISNWFNGKIEAAEASKELKTIKSEFCKSTQEVYVNNELAEDALRYIVTPISIASHYSSFTVETECDKKRREENFDEAKPLPLTINKNNLSNSRVISTENNNLQLLFSSGHLENNSNQRAQNEYEILPIANTTDTSRRWNTHSTNTPAHSNELYTNNATVHYYCNNNVVNNSQSNIQQTNIGEQLTMSTDADKFKPSKNDTTQLNSFGSTSANTSANIFTVASKYRILLGKEELGKGAQGVVYKCHTIDNEVVVSKEMEFDECNRGLFLIQLRQAERMRKLNHPHLIRYLDVVAYNNPLKISIIMPYYKDGDLKEFIAKQRQPLEELQACSIILQITEALKYLHSQEPPLIHRDVKPENILLLNEEQVLLMDLDLCTSAEMIASITKRRPVNTTEEYRAPELANGTGSTKSDIFSLGVVSFVLAVMPEFPFVTNDKGEQLIFSEKHWTHQSLERATRRAFHTMCRYQYSDEFVSLICRMLSPTPSERPSANEVIEKITQLM